MTHKNKQIGSHHVGIVLVLVVVLIGILGFVGYNSWQRSRADAGGTTLLGRAADTSAFSAEEQAEIEATSNQDISPRVKDGSSKVFLKVGTYNLLGAGAQEAAAFNSKRGTNNRERAASAAEVINNSEVDVIGVQESDKVDDHFGILKSGLAKRYAMYPSSTDVRNRQWLRPIIYNKERFTFVDGGSFSYPYQDAKKKDNGNFEFNDDGTWIKLNSGSRVFYVINVHFVARNIDCRWECNPLGTEGGSDNGGAEKRKATAEKLVKMINNFKSQGSVLVTGDFNSFFVKRDGNRAWIDEAIRREKGLPYCVLTADNLIQHVYDKARGRSGQCPSTDKDLKNGAWIDHIYATSGFSVTDGPWAVVNKRTKSTSDHMPVFVNLSL